MIECKEKLEILKKLNFLKHGVYSAEDIKKICHIKYQTEFVKMMLFEIAVKRPDRFRYTAYVDKSIDKFVVY